MAAATLKKTRIRPSKYCRSVRITVGQVREAPEPATEDDPGRPTRGTD